MSFGHISYLTFDISGAFEKIKKSTLELAIFWKSDSYTSIPCFFLWKCQVITGDLLPVLFILYQISKGLVFPTKC